MPVIVALLVVLLTSSALAQADSDAQQQACLDSFAKTQELRDEKKLVESREHLLICASDKCPGPVTSQCVIWLDELDAALPSVVFSAKGPDGKDVVAVRVTESGVVIAESLTGAAVTMNPGPHELTFSLAGQPAVTQPVVLNEGEKNRKVEVSWQASDPVVEEGSISPLVWIGFGVGAAGLIAGTITGILALSAASDLEDKCADEGCTDDEISSEQTIAHVSTIAFAVGGAGIVVGVIGLIIGGDAEAQVGDATLRLMSHPGGLGIAGSF